MAVTPLPLSPSEVRALCRADKFTGASTAGLSPGRVQANIVIVQKEYADDFRRLCARNPVPCPLLGETFPGDFRLPKHLARDADVRTDCPAYNVYVDGVLQARKTDLLDEWNENSVAFFIGCSFSFEETLIKNGLTPKHVMQDRNVPMYTTKVPLHAAGVFSGNTVVSLRAYPKESIPLVKLLTAPFYLAHGEPIAIGREGALALGLTDLDGSSPDFGDATQIEEGEVGVYWGCGVTPQQAVMDSGIKGLVACHAPGQMLVLDMFNEAVCN